jgi:hypothetical protein
MLSQAEKKEVRSCLGNKISWCSRGRGRLPLELCKLSYFSASQPEITQRLQVIGLSVALHFHLMIFYNLGLVTFIFFISSSFT